MTQLPPIPAKRYFTISEVALLCDVKPHVLRYWEQEFVQLRPMKRRGNRRYYQHHELLMVRRIRSLLYEEGFTIQGARNQLRSRNTESIEALSSADGLEPVEAGASEPCQPPPELPSPVSPHASMEQVRRELKEIRTLLAL